MPGQPGPHGMIFCLKITEREGEEEGKWCEEFLRTKGKQPGTVSSAKEQCFILRKHSCSDSSTGIRNLLCPTSNKSPQLYICYKKAYF